MSAVGILPVGRRVHLLAYGEWREGAIVAAPSTARGRYTVRYVSNRRTGTTREKRCTARDIFDADRVRIADLTHVDAGAAVIVDGVSRVLAAKPTRCGRDGWWCTFTDGKPSALYGLQPVVKGQ